MLPPPPGLLTTETVVLTSLVDASARSSVRAVLSLLPPGPDAATISTFFCGDHVCAIALLAATSAAATIHRLVFIRPSSADGTASRARRVKWLFANRRSILQADARGDTRMNIVPRLFQDPTWATIASFSTNELIELVMLSLMSAGLIAAACYGIYIGLF